MFHSLSLSIFASVFTHGLILGVNGEAAKKLAPGMYKIVNPTSAALARNLPGAGPRGPWLTSITITKDVSSNYQTWEVLASGEGYKIQNYGSKNSAFSHGNKGDTVTGFSEGFTKWYIEATGGAEYRVSLDHNAPVGSMDPLTVPADLRNFKIHYPSRDLVWTVDNDDTLLNTVSLQPFHGGDTQVFRFDKL